MTNKDFQSKEKVINNVTNTELHELSMEELDNVSGGGTPWSHYEERLLWFGQPPRESPSPWDIPEN